MTRRSYTDRIVWSMDLMPRIFISSVMFGYAGVRQAAISAVLESGCEPLYAEQFQATGTSPRTACLDAVASCDGLILILGERYGEPTDSGLSATEEEYKEAVERSLSIYAFVEQVEHEPRQATFISQIEHYVSGHLRKSFGTPEELASLIKAALAQSSPIVSRGDKDERGSHMIDQMLGERPPQAQGTA